MEGLIYYSLPQLVVKVHMKDNSTKSLMVDERQTARDILDNLFEKTHCDCRVDWCLYEIYTELQIGELPSILGSLVLMLCFNSFTLDT